MKKHMSLSLTALCGLILLQSLNSTSASAATLELPETAWGVSVFPSVFVAWAVLEGVDLASATSALVLAPIAASSGVSLASLANSREIINAVKADTADYITTDGARISGALSAVLNVLREKSEDPQETSTMRSLADLSDMEIIKGLYFESNR
jgi:hypothetical protein